MRCLVTGGAGFIGSHLAKKLDKDHDVFVIDDLSNGTRDNVAWAGIHSDRFHVIDFSKRYDENDELHDLFKEEKFDVVFHIGALPRVQFSIQHPLASNRANVDGTLNMLMYCKDYDVKRFVFSSSSSLYGDQEKMPIAEDSIPNPMSPYALHKLTGEHYCSLFNRLWGLETVSLRYFNVYGPRQSPDSSYAALIPKVIKKMKDNEAPTINGTGEQQRDFTYIDDVVNANLLASTVVGEKVFGSAFNIGGGSPVSVNHVVRCIARILDSKVVADYGPALIEPEITHAKISKARKVLEWVPGVSFLRGLKLTIDWSNE